MAAVCGQASAWPGSKFPGIPTPYTAATQSRRKDRGSSKLKTWSLMHAYPHSEQEPRIRSPPFIRWGPQHVLLSDPNPVQDCHCTKAGAP